MSIISSIADHLLTSAILERRRATLSLLEQNPDAKLLDCGCGDGELTLKVAERIGTRKIYGIDVVEESLVEAKEKGIEVYQGDLNQKLPFDDESFDVVYASEIIEHLYNTDLFITESHRVLRKGGYILIETPNLAGIHNIFFLLFGKQPPPATVSDKVFVGSWGTRGRCINTMGPGHCRIFTLAALKELLEYYGFKVEKSIGSGFYPLPTSLARVMCLIDKRHAAYITVKARRRE